MQQADGVHLGEGEAVSSNERDRLLREASALKMRAMRLRTLGDADDQWEATVLFREAARKDLAALAALQRAPEQEEAGARIEACGLFLEGHDPVRAAEEWARLPRWVFSTEDGAAMLEKLKPLYDEVLGKFSGAWRRLAKSPGSVPEPGEISEEQIRRLLEDHPGVAELWWALSVRATSEEEAHVARAKVGQLEPSWSDDAAARSSWERAHHLVLRTLTIEMRAEGPDDSLALDSVSRVVAKFGELISGFVDRAFGGSVKLIPSGARTGSFILDVAVQGLPPHALDELNDALTGAAERVDAGVLGELLALLQQNRIRLTASLVPVEPGPRGASPTKLVIDAKRRKALIKAAEAAALRTIDSNNVPQANDLERVFRIVEMVARQEALDADVLEITPRQVGYYRRATKILGFLTESDELTAAGRLITRLGSEDRLRATVVHFESSICGDAWIRWSKGKTLLDVEPETVTDFLRDSVPGLSKITAARRAQTLIRWHSVLVEHHYAR